MLKISDFSMLSKVPMKTLRYYDQIGLLKPAKIDNTGYRYYSAEQLLDINRIFIFKELGFTLHEIFQLLHEQISSEQIRGMLRLKESEIERMIGREQSKLAGIKERMQLVEREGSLEKEQEVVIKAVEGLQLVSYPSHGPTEIIPELFCTLDQLLDKQTRAFLTGPQTVLWKESNETDGDFVLEAGYRCKRELPVLARELRIRSLPAEPMMATLLFHSDSSFAASACIDLASWIEKNGYRIKEDQPGRELYLPISGNPEENGDVLMEIQIPIEKNE